MPLPQDIAQHQERLAVYRASLATRLTQQAVLGSAHAPPVYAYDIGEARAAIERLKATLRSWGVPTEDLPDDGVLVPPQSVPPPSPLPPERTVRPDPTRRLKVFLCHASKDKPAVRQLAQRLHAVGVAPWLDTDDLLPGQRRQIAIPNAVRDTDVVLVCLSRYAVTKTGYEELAFALNVAAQQPEEAIYLIPLRLENCTAPEQLRDRQGVDLFAEDGFQRLLRALQVHAAEVGALPPASAAPTSPQPEAPKQRKAPAVQPRPPIETPTAPPVVKPANGAPVLRQRTAWKPPWRYVAGVLLTGVVVSLLAFIWVSRETIIPFFTPTPRPLVPEMLAVPAGPFLMGSSDTDTQAASNEKPQHLLTLPDYWIGKTEVTNAQFRPFVDGDGYTDPAYWTAAGWAWQQENKITQPAYWNDAQWNGADYPVVGVSWFEAVAYCRWLSKQTGIEFRLPSEAEWEKAARGTEGWIYPWGNTWDTKLANSSEAGLNLTTPVGTYPTGVSPYGALDMAGNVWEWGATQWGKSYPYQIEDEWQAAYLEADAAYRVLRGGSWYNTSTAARGAYRSGDIPRVRGANEGLRVASHSLVP